MKWYNPGKKSFVPRSPKFVGAERGERSWENMFIDVDIEISATLDDWLKDEFKNYFRKWNAGIFNAVTVQTDEDDVTFGYIEMQKVILPYIAKYISTSDNGSRYRIFFFSEIKPSKFDPSAYDYEEEINKLVEKGSWDI